jgi:signal transduction histidine kinase
LHTKNTIIRYISHELRTPLNSVTLGLKLIIDGLEDTDDAGLMDLYETAVDANHAVSGAIELVESLRYFDKIKNGRLELQRSEVAILQFVEDCVHSFSLCAQEQDVRLRMYHSPTMSNPPQTRGTSNRHSVAREYKRSYIPSHSLSNVSTVANSCTINFRIHNNTHFTVKVNRQIRMSSAVAKCSCRL